MSKVQTAARKALGGCDICRPGEICCKHGHAMQCDGEGCTRCKQPTLRQSMHPATWPCVKCGRNREIPQGGTCADCAEQPLRVGDRVEIVKRAIGEVSRQVCETSPEIGEIGIVKHIRPDLEFPYRVSVEGKLGWCYPASSLRRIAEQSVAPAEYAYIAGECCEILIGTRWMQATLAPGPDIREGHHCVFQHEHSGTVIMPYSCIRPVAATPGCAVRHVETGEIGLVVKSNTDGVRVWIRNADYPYDPAVWRVIALPR